MNLLEELKLRRATRKDELSDAETATRRLEDEVDDLDTAIEALCEAYGVDPIELDDEEDEMFDKIYEIEPEEKPIINFPETASEPEAQPEDTGTAQDENNPLQADEQGTAEDSGPPPTPEGFEHIDDNGDTWIYTGGKWTGGPGGAEPDAKPNLDNDLVVDVAPGVAEVIPSGERETPPELAFVDEADEPTDSPFNAAPIDQAQNLADMQGAPVEASQFNNATPPEAPAEPAGEQEALEAQPAQTQPETSPSLFAKLFRLKEDA